ncbi:MAG: thioredoxin domain-containing protein [Planctomycetota bacterium]
MPNRLAQETSPYLLQHANNPVDWYPWGDEALQLAQQRDCPIFLSIGYSACHWCHVMEHESFESQPIADFLNAHFVCIKVDREERPDIDQVYMAAVQLMTGRGGWPMSMFLMPDQRPFFGGTYWPPTAQRGMSGFDQVIRAVWDAWENRREEAEQQSARLTQRVAEVVSVHGPAEEISGEPTLRSAAAQLEAQFDFTHGGFGTAPKFPQPMSLQVLLRAWKRTHCADLLDLVQLNLDKMAAGGIYDHLGGGFARYSVDERWLVPHFEKMLYDNAQLAAVFADAYAITGKQAYAEVLRQTLEYVRRDMQHPDGGFYSAEDADSEGVEGKFYVWTPSEIMEVLGDALGARFCEVYDVSPTGNFEHGQSILNLSQSIEQVARRHQESPEVLRNQMRSACATLFAHRERRIHPGKDDKVITAWNGLMIDAMARAAMALSETCYQDAAAAAVTFVLDKMRDAEGRLLHSWRDDRARCLAFLDDYACFLNGLVSLYEASGDERWIAEAEPLADAMLDRFRGHESGRLFYTASDQEQLITRVSDLHDNAMPSGNGMAATALARLGRLLNRDRYLDVATAIVKSAKAVIEQAPTAAAQSLIALDLLTGPFQELVLVGGSEDLRAQAVRAVQRRYTPNAVLAVRSRRIVAALDPLFAGREAEPDVTLFICEGSQCQAPIRGLEAITGATL